MKKQMYTKILASLIVLNCPLASAGLPMFHVGIGGGYNSGSTKLLRSYKVVNPSPADKADLSAKGPVGQINLGLDYVTTNNFYAGLQVSGFLTKIKGKQRNIFTSTQSLLGVPIPTPTALKSEVKLNRVLQVDARFGKQIESFIPHAILGLATGQWKMRAVSQAAKGQANQKAPTFVTKKSKTRYGLVLGLGVDYNVTQCFFVRAEYQYTWYKRISLTHTQSNGKALVHYRIKPNTNMAMLSIGWRFG